MSRQKPYWDNLVAEAGDFDSPGIGADDSSDLIQSELNRDQVQKTNGVAAKAAEKAKEAAAKPASKAHGSQKDIQVKSGGDFITAVGTSFYLMIKNAAYGLKTMLTSIADGLKAITSGKGPMEALSGLASALFSIVKFALFNPDKGKPPGLLSLALRFVFLEVPEIEDGKLKEKDGKFLVSPGILMAGLDWAQSAFSGSKSAASNVVSLPAKPTAPAAPSVSVEQAATLAARQSDPAKPVVGEFSASAVSPAASKVAGKPL